MLVDDALRAVSRPDLFVVSSLQDNWHGDHHWLVADGATGERFGLRATLIGREIRWEEPRRYNLETAAAQVAAARVFVASGIPLAAPIAGPVEAGDRLVVMCEWLDGEIATRPTPERAFAIGEMLARMHRLPIPIDDRLPVHDLFTTAAKSLAMLPEAAQASEIVDRARGDDPRVVVHGDVNFPNVLWAGDRVTGLVDLDQIGLSRPIEELAWAVKWWSRTGGIGDHDPDPALARAVIEGYGGVEDRDALAAMVWIAGCLNANSVLRADAAGERRTRADRLARVVAQ